LRATVDEVAKEWDELRYADALGLTERFFWDWFTDAYIELCKMRARAGDGSAVATLRRALDVLVRMFAPVLPFVTEEIWRWTHGSSVHRAPWPMANELDDVPAPDSAQTLVVAREALAAVHRYKAAHAVAAGRPLDALVLAAPPPTSACLERVADDVAGATRTASLSFVADPAVAAIEVRAASLTAARPAR
jgi:valyl-tRNA synthetase